jgi:23S rRNA (pseudouridine1915-N3)-methyltransferase
MKIRIIAYGQRMPGWVNEAWADFSKRLPRSFNLELVELPLQKRGAGQLDKIRAQEDEKMCAAIRPGERVIALEVGGKAWSTEQLSVELEAWQNSGDDYAILIGGPEGLGPKSLAAAQQSRSLSKLTLPHPLVRVLLVEQLYRAWTIQVGHPYHR